MAYNFHYTPTGTGVISGKEVLEQTEDAINDLGNTAISGVEEALDKAEQALTNSANAVDDAQTALNTANNADENATTALNTVNNLSGTVTSLGNRVTTAEGNITNLQGRMTTAEGNVTNLQGRMTTAEGNITTLQSNVSTAQATANSAQQTATTARQQSYVFRYSSSSITNNSTIAYSTIDNTDNIKVGDKILDVDGKLFEITAVDTANQTVTVGSALIDLALDANVVHTSGNETIEGDKTFSGKIYSNNYFYGNTAWGLDKANVWTGNNTFQQNIFYERTNFYQQVANPCYVLKDTGLEKGNLVSVARTAYPGLWQDKDGNILGYMRFVEYATGRQTAEIRVSNLIKNGTLDPTGSEVNCSVNLELQSSGEKSLIPELNNDINLGTSTNKWKSLNGLTPSSLGMPSDRSARVDISGYFTNTANGDTNTYTVPANGWIYLNLNDVIVAHCFAQTAGNLSHYAQTFARASAGQLHCLFPVRKDDVFVSQWTTSTTVTVTNAYFIPCLGNI